MNRQVGWLIFAGIFLGMAGILLGIHVLLAPLGSGRDLAMAQELRLASGLSEAGVQGQVDLPGSRILRALEFADGSTVLMMDVPEYRGDRLWTIVLDKKLEPLRYQPAPALRDSALYSGLLALVPDDKPGHAAVELDAVSGATMDLTLLRKAVLSATAILAGRKGASHD